MPQVSFGTILRNERERLGYDIPSVANRLRIRPDILRAIEASNFEQMPPRGYARNMIQAYSRDLGLNPNEITRLYLDEAYAFQVTGARATVPFTNYDASANSSRRRGVSATTEEEPVLERRSQAAMNRESTGRTMYHDDRGGRSRGEEAERVYSEERTHRSNRSAMPSTQYTNFYAGPQASSGAFSKLPVILIAAIVVVAVAAVVIFFLVNKSKDDGELPNAPVTGVSTDAEGNAQPLPPPTRTVFKYVIEDGASGWIDIFEGERVIDSFAAEGPDQKSYDVTTEITFFTTVPKDKIKIYQDKDELQFGDPDGRGLYSVKVSFATALEKWQQNNPTAQPAQTAPEAAENAGATTDNPN